MLWFSIRIVTKTGDWNMSLDRKEAGDWNITATIRTQSAGRHIVGLHRSEIDGYFDSPTEH